MDRIHFHGSRRLLFVCRCLLILTFVYMNIVVWGHHLQLQALIPLEFFSLATVVLIVTPFCSFTPRFLLSTFSLITAWRLAALAHLQVVVTLYLLALLLKFCNYIIAASHDIQAQKERSELHQFHNTRFEWQLLFIRMFIGFDLIPHFCEKLFAGTAVRADDVQAFVHLGVSHPLAMVFIAGCIELAGSFAIGVGFITRLGSICLFIYLMAATVMGHHFQLGFIWASPGGGWEYPVLWSTLILSFGVFGANSFSLDYDICSNHKTPRWLRLLMGISSRYHAKP